jgi:hypothetical protein
LEVLQNLLRDDVRKRWSLPRARSHKWFDGFELTPPSRGRYLFSDQTVEDAFNATQVYLPQNFELLSEPTVYSSQPDEYASTEFGSTDVSSEDAASEYTDVSLSTRLSKSSSQAVEELLRLDPNAITMDITQEATVIAHLGTATHTEPADASVSGAAEQSEVPQTLLCRSSRRQAAIKKEIARARKPAKYPTVPVPAEEDDEEAAVGQKRRRSERLKEKMVAKKRKF